MSKKVNRRQILKAIVFGSTGITLAACQAPAATTPATPAAPEPKPQDSSATRYQGRFVIMSVANADRSAPLIQAIEEAHPGVKVEWRFLPSERFVELFTAAEVAGDQIDVMDLNGQDLRRYAVGGKLKDLSDIPYKDRFREVAIKTYTIGGKTWALPRGGISGFTYLINKKAFERVGFD